MLNCLLFLGQLNLSLLSLPAWEPLKSETDGQESCTGPGLVNSTNASSLGFRESTPSWVSSQETCWRDGAVRRLFKVCGGKAGGISKPLLGSVDSRKWHGTRAKHLTLIAQPMPLTGWLALEGDSSFCSSFTQMAIIAEATSQLCDTGETKVQPMESVQ